jgi:hypothetical protein
MNGCLNCKHLKLTKCPAFPNGIPLHFASGDFLHSEVLPYQEGELTWELRPPRKLKVG